MTKARLGFCLVAGCLLWSHGAAVAQKPQYSPEDALKITPNQIGILYSTPTAQEVAACKLELVKGAGSGNGYLLRDPKGRALRRFFDTNGDGKVDIWSYYHEGVETYREIDSSLREGKPDQYRWLNAAGSKWGVDLNKDGKIDRWQMISAEEVSQEVLAAIITRDFARLQALFITGEEMQAYGMPATETARIQALLQQSAAKFQNTIAKLANSLNEKTRWLHLETSAPQCTPADQLGTKYDILRYSKATVLCETNGKHEWINLGEVIRVGPTWRIVDAPSQADAADPAPADPVLQGLLDKLRAHDQNPPTSSSASIAAYNLARADLLEQIISKVKREEWEQWVKQDADCLSAAAQNSPANDQTGFNRLKNLETQVAKALPGQPLAGYVTFRVMTAENTAKLNEKGADPSKVQDQWAARLAEFVQAYPDAEDTPEALMQLGMVSEFLNKETEARKWYGMLTGKFAQHPITPKAEGALRRLEIEGKPLQLAGPQIGGGMFNINQLRGKHVVVYYWASWNQGRCVAELFQLFTIMNNPAYKGKLEIVCVNLDNTLQEATSFLQGKQAPQTHLFQPGGADSSPLALQYGVMVLPHLFLVDKEGVVISRTVQMGNLEEELKKRLQ